jgi:hypothetical protein
LSGCLGSRGGRGSRVTSHAQVGLVGALLGPAPGGADLGRAERDAEVRRAVGTRPPASPFRPSKSAGTSWPCVLARWLPHCDGQWQRRPERHPETMAHSNRKTDPNNFHQQDDRQPSKDGTLVIVCSGYIVGDPTLALHVWNLETGQLEDLAGAYRTALAASPTLRASSWGHKDGGTSGTWRRRRASRASPTPPVRSRRSPRCVTPPGTASLSTGPWLRRRDLCIRATPADAEAPFVLEAGKDGGSGVNPSPEARLNRFPLPVNVLRRYRVPGPNLYGSPIELEGLPQASIPVLKATLAPLAAKFIGTCLERGL